jgi:hypothetical protein
MKRRKQKRDSKLPMVIGIDAYNEDASKRYFKEMQKGKCPSRLAYFFFNDKGEPKRKGYVLITDYSSKWFLLRRDADKALDYLKGKRS